MSIKKTAVWILKHFFRPWGYSPNFMYYYIKEIKEDFLNNRSTTLRQKLWAYKRGFLSYRIQMNGLTEENYVNYISDFDYAKIQPVNGSFSKWIDDKLTIKYILNSFDEYLPEYYYYISAGSKEPVTTRLMDCPMEFGQRASDMIGLLQQKKVLAAKLVAGSSGKGFYKLHCKHNYYYVNEQQLDYNEMLEFLETLNGYILTEYLLCHDDLGRIWDRTPNSIRIVMLNKEGIKPEVVGSWIKFGTDKTGPVDNWSAGGVVAHVNSTSGHFAHGMIFENYKWVECKVHPDSGVLVEGTVPFWDDIMQMVLSICKYLAPLKLMGFDIVVTDSSFKVIEINSKPAIDIHSYYELQHTNDRLRDFFADLISSKRTR